MEAMNNSEHFPQFARSMSFQEFVASRPEAAFALVQFLSEEVQAADGCLRMVWERIPAGFPIGRA
jgi:hypothetical protein